MITGDCSAMVTFNLLGKKKNDNEGMEGTASVMNEDTEYRNIFSIPNNNIGQGYSPQPCHTCCHYNGSKGDIECAFCDPEFGEDRWSDSKYDPDEEPDYDL